MHLCGVRACGRVICSPFAGRHVDMAVLLETTIGEIVIDLFVDQCPDLSRNFVKLCKLKFYHGCLVYNVQQNCLIQTGDPTATGRGGAAVRGVLAGEADGAPTRRFLADDPSSRPELKHDRTGLVSMVTMGKVPGGSGGSQLFGSQFFFTTRAEDLEHLNGEHAPFGEIAEGADVLAALNALYCDTEGRPYVSRAPRDRPAAPRARGCNPPALPLSRAPPTRQHCVTDGTERPASPRRRARAPLRSDTRTCGCCTRTCSTTRSTTRRPSSSRRSCRRRRRRTSDRRARPSSRASRPRRT